jgi:ABC-2 type transport system permease protein
MDDAHGFMNRFINGFMNDARTRASGGTAQRLPGLLPLLAAQVRYQLLLLTRTPRALIAGLIMPGVLLALRLGSVKHVSGHGPALPLAASVAGLAMFGILSIAYMTHASGLVAAREDGVLRRWRATPLPAGGYFFGRITATVLLADASGVVLIMVGVAMAGLHVTAAMMASLLLAATLGALTLASVATAVTIAIPATQSANPVLMITYLPLVLFSGAFGSISGLPHWLAEVMSYLPAQPLIDAATRTLADPGGGFAGISGRDTVLLALWAAMGAAVSVRFFRWDPHRPAHARVSARASSTGRP